MPRPLNYKEQLFLLIQKYKKVTMQDIERLLAEGYTILVFYEMMGRMPETDQELKDSDSMQTLYTYAYGKSNTPSWHSVPYSKKPKKKKGRPFGC